MNGCLKAGLIGVALLVLGLVGLGVLAAAFGDDVDEQFRAAGKDNGVEVSLSEFEAIENGMTLEQVERIIGGEGQLMSSAGAGEVATELYTWDGNGLGANANVTFQGGKVVGKAQFGLD